MRRTKLLIPMPPETAWKFSDRLDHIFQVTDVWENSDNIVEWLRVGSWSDIDTVMLAVQMCYAGLAIVDFISEDPRKEQGWLTYNVHLFYGEN